MAPQRPLPGAVGGPACAAVPRHRGRRRGASRRGGGSRARVGELPVGRVVPRPLGDRAHRRSGWTRDHRGSPALDQRRTDGAVLLRPRAWRSKRSSPTACSPGRKTRPSRPRAPSAGWSYPQACSSPSTSVGTAVRGGASRWPPTSPSRSGVLALLGSRVPAELKVLLLGLAIVDDVGAIVVIAAFYSDDLHWSLACRGDRRLLVVALLRRARVRYVPVYIALGLGVWLATFESGVHATIAGVASVSSPRRGRCCPRSTPTGSPISSRPTTPSPPRRCGTSPSGSGVDPRHPTPAGPAPPVDELPDRPGLRACQRRRQVSADGLRDAASSSITTRRGRWVGARQARRRLRRHRSRRASRCRSPPRWCDHATRRRHGRHRRHRLHRLDLRCRPRVRRSGPDRSGDDRRAVASVLAAAVGSILLIRTERAGSR